MSFFDKNKKALVPKCDIESRVDEPTPSRPIRNFNYLDELIHNGVKEIVLDSNITLDDDEEFKYLNGIKVDVDDLTIDGRGFTIDAREKTRIFFCTGKNISIKNIVFKSGSRNNGGAVFNAEGELKIYKSKFLENRAKSGGAIYNILGKLTITDSTFNDNQSKNGGAIYNEEAEFTIVNSTFKDNTAQIGGAILHITNDLDITKSTFVRNMSLVNGGAIVNVWGKLNIDDSALNENISLDSGGAVYNYNGKVTIAKSRFDKNMASNFRKAKKQFIEKNKIPILSSHIESWKDKLLFIESLENPSPPEYHGGAIYSYGMDLVISQSSFNSNIAKGKGGAIACLNEENLKLTDCEFKNNQEYVQELESNEYKHIIHRFIDDLGIKDETEKYACEIYEKVMQNDLNIDMDDGLIIVACLYFACRENEEPYDMEDIADATNIEKKKIRRAFAIITRKLNLKIKLPSPLLYIPRFSSDLKLSDKAQSKAIEIVEKAIENGIVLGKNPKGIAAAAIYLACKSVGDKIEQKKISDVVGITETTIRLRCDDLADLD